MKYSSRMIAFYSNSTATFNPSFDLFARCGDVHPMPGPQATTSEHHSKLSLKLLNARSLVNKLVDFQASIYANSVDIVIVTETWLTSAILDHEILPSCYDVYRRDRGEDKRGGGVLIAIKNGVASARRTDLETNCELVVVEVTRPGATSFLLVDFIVPRRQMVNICWRLRTFWQMPNEAQLPFTSVVILIFLISSGIFK